LRKGQGLPGETGVASKLDVALIDGLVVNPLIKLAGPEDAR
jgi:hypothetical protein